MTSDKAGTAIKGSCLCGSVRYEVRESLPRLLHCHCSMCRKSHGSAFATYARVKRADFSLLAGERAIKSYRSSANVTRTFCGSCGSRLQFISDSAPESFGLAVGTLDDDPIARPKMHIFVGSKAPWFEIADELPRHDARP